jgi:hypothetical protein
MAYVLSVKVNAGAMVVQKLQFLNNNRWKSQNAEHFARTCETSNRVLNKSDVIHAGTDFSGFKENRTSNANSLQNKDLQRTDEIETT